VTHQTGDLLKVARLVIVRKSMRCREAATPRTTPPSLPLPAPAPPAWSLLLRCVHTLWAHGAPLTALPCVRLARRLGWNAAQAAEPEPQPALPSKESI